MGAASSFLKRIGFLMTRSHQPTAGPPPEVRAEIDAAWERAQALVDGAYELHFEHDRALRRAWGELQLPGGVPMLRLSATEALALACGDPVALPV
jgi:hypothetical protein